jgi:hypothetical protein
LDSTPFWALALMRQKEYRSAGVPMLPVVVGERETYRQIVLYAVLLLLASILPVFLSLLGPLYLLLALLLNSIFVWQAIDIWRRPSNTHIWRLYKFSLLFGLALFGDGAGPPVLPRAVRCRRFCLAARVAAGLRQGRPRPVLAGASGQAGCPGPDVRCLPAG